MNFVSHLNSETRFCNMKKIRIITIAILITLCSFTMAQPGPVKNAAKSVFTLTTFKDDGSILASSHGVFIGNNGEAISELKPFIGAKSAVVIDSKGTKMDVTRMLGANSIYNVAKFRVNGNTTPAAIATNPSVTGAQAWLVGYALKSPEIKQTSIKSVEKFMDKYSYYIFGTNAQDNTSACPFVNSKGEIIGLMQSSTTSNDTHATDARYINSLSVNGMSCNEDAFRQTGIPMALPTDQTQATLALMMIGQNNDSTKYSAAIDDFISLFPNLTDGYTARANVALAEKRTDIAAENMETAIKKADKKADAHYNYGRMIYNNIMYNNIQHDGWTLDRALEEANTANEMTPTPLYKHLQAQIIFSKGDYQKAHDMFMDLTKTSFDNPELYYEAAQCKQMLNAPNNEILVLLDSAINRTDTLNMADAAPYFLMRAGVYEKEGKYRLAVFDYTRYEIVLGGNVTHDFYYIREQAEVKAKLYKQALIDINVAILMNPQEPIYHAEKASLLLRVNKIEDAIANAEQSIKVAPDYAEGYTLIGIGQIRLGKKKEGLENLKKAKELGSEQAQALIDKYSK